MNGTKQFAKQAAEKFKGLSPLNKALAVTVAAVLTGVAVTNMILYPVVGLSILATGFVFGMAEHGLLKLVERHDKRKEEKNAAQAPDTSGPTLDSKCPALGPQFALAQSGTALDSSITVRAPLQLKR
jgi:hypothetical protein